MKTQVSKAFVAAACIFAAGNVSALPITTWTVDVDTKFDISSVEPTPGVTVVNDKSLRWGTSTGSGQSGLDISGSPASTKVDTNGSAVANVSVTHLNQPITGTSLTSVDILSTLTLTPFLPAGLGLPSATITFGVDFKETPNGADPCADGGANGSGVNSSGCADIFVIDKSALNFEFFYDDLDGSGITGRSYFISFFELTNGLNPLSGAACLAATGSSATCFGFETPEGANTTFQFASLITTERVGIPEPGILALFGAALSSIFFTRRRKA